MAKNRSDAQAARISRRHLLRAAGAAGAALALRASDTVTAVQVEPDRGGGQVTAADLLSAAAVPFYGRHQAGIATPTQNHLHFAAFDVLTEDKNQLRELLRAWSTAAARMCAGEPVGDLNEHPFLPPEDTGEAVGHPPARLTVTFGFGPTLFNRGSADRFGLASRRPRFLAEIPPMPGDELDPRRSGGDLCIQACADDPQVAFHAVRNLDRIATGVAAIRWLQIGFGRAANTTRAQETPRNLFGFKDGTNNIDAASSGEMDHDVWVQPGDGPAWLAGGTYLVARRIRMLIEEWDNTSLGTQEKVFGRHKLSGAPAGGLHEREPLDVTARGADGELLIPTNAHLRVARGNGGERILRRGYSYTEGLDPVSGKLDAGLFFICFARDPLRQFVPMQRRLAENDALNEYTTHTGSAVYACPPGAAEYGYVGETLFK